MTARKRNENGSIFVSGRLSFPSLGKPETPPGAGKQRYALHLLIPKDGEEHKLVEQVIQELAVQRWGKFDQNGKLTNKDQILKTITSIKNDPRSCCLRDGDLKAYDGYEGMMVLSAYNQVPGKPAPLCVDQNRVKLGPDDIITTFYSGCYVNAIVNMWIQDSATGKGVRASIGGVQFWKDGPRFGGGSSTTESDFDVIEPVPSDFDPLV